MATVLELLGSLDNARLAHVSVAIWLLLASALLLHFAPRTRSTLRLVWGLVALALPAFVLAALATRAGFDEAGELLREFGILLEGIAVIRISTAVLFQLVLARGGEAPPRIIEDLVTVAACVAFGLIRLRYAGLELSQIVTTSAVITGVVAFAMQDTLGNVLGGLGLQVDNSLRIGDWIKLGDINGRVSEIRWRSTSIETRNWETIVVPNSVLMRGEFIVLGRRGGQPEQWRRWVWFHVGYETAPGRVIEVVNHAIRHADIDNVATDPAPNCVMMDYEKLCGRYALRYWLTDLAVDDPTDSEVRVHIYAALRRNGIDPFVPESFRTIRAPSSDEVATDDERELERRVTLLGTIDLFAPLTEDERRALAPRLRPTPFVAGDHMTEQGADAHWLYIVTAGRAEVVLEENGRSQHISWIDGGESASYFGEMGLMTGARRSASVIARSDVECLRLDKDAFASIVHARPELANLLCRLMDERRSGIAAGADRLARGAGDDAETSTAAELLRRMKLFFNLD